MKKILAITALTATAFGLNAAWADSDKVQHFKGLDAPDLSTALTNLSEYNQKLSQVISKENLTAEDLAEIHQLTYTLENAIERIEDEVEDIGEILENVHVASETMEPETAQSEAKKYLEKSNLLTKGVN